MSRTSNYDANEANRVVALDRKMTAAGRELRRLQKSRGWFMRLFGNPLSILDLMDRRDDQKAREAGRIPKNPAGTMG